MCLLHEYLKHSGSMETQKVLRVIIILIPLSFCRHELEIQTQVHTSDLFPLGRGDKKERMYAESTVKAYFHSNFTGTVFSM